MTAAIVPIPDTPKGGPMTQPVAIPTPRPTPRPDQHRLYAVRLIDRRTGEVPSLNGTPLSQLTHAPQAVAQSLMRGRDRRIWRAEIEPAGFA